MNILIEIALYKWQFYYYIISPVAWEVLCDSGTHVRLPECEQNHPAEKDEKDNQHFSYHYTEQWYIWQ